MVDRRKILHISDTLCYGGKENVVINICNGLNKEKYSVYLVVLSNDNLSQIGKLDPNVNLIVLPFSERSITGIHSLLFFFRGIPYLKKILLEINPSIVHTHTTFYRLFFAFIAIRNSAIKSQQFHTIHTSGTFINPTTLYEKFKLIVERNILKILKPKIIAVSKLAEEKCILHLKNCYSSLICIPNGINANEYYKDYNPDAKTSWGFNANDIVLVYVSRLCKGKNHLILLKAIAILSKKIDNVRLSLVGDGELRVLLENYVKSNSLQKYVSFLGATDKVNEILSVSDIGVFPSEYEGMSIALLEMMATGLPMVCSDIPIFKQIFIEPGSAIFFPVMNHISLSSKLEDLCHSKELQKEMSKKSKKIANEYTIEEMIRKHEDYYK